jgi:hypothetical protein
MLLRVWNLCGGDSHPPSRRTYAREMVELVTAGAPGFVCLQEVPGAALESLGAWAGMQAVAVRTRRGVLGRGAMGHAILVPKDAKVRETKQITLNTNPFCESEGARLGLTEKQARAWEKPRRVCHFAKVELPNRRRLLLANLHTTVSADPRLADAELRRAVNFVDRASEYDELVVFAGVFGVAREHSHTLQTLTTREHDPYLETGPASVRVLIRGGRPDEIRVWTEDERRHDGTLLSAEPPVELQLLAKVRRTARQEQPAAPVPAPPPSEPQPQVAAAKEDDRWETPDGDRWETGSERWEDY